MPTSATAAATAPPSLRTGPGAIDVDDVFATPAPARPSTRVLGLLVLAATVASATVVALDPMATGQGARAILQSIADHAGLHRGVHVVAQLCLVAFAAGVAAIGARLGSRRPAIVLGVTAYLAGCGALLCATVFDGFITPDLALRYLRPGIDPEMGLHLVRLAGMAVTDLSAVGWGLQAVGIVGLSAALLANGGTDRRFGIAGLVGGIAPLAAMAAAWPVMDTTVVVAVLLSQAAWNVTAGWLLLRRSPAR